MVGTLWLLFDEGFADAVQLLSIYVYRTYGYLGRHAGSHQRFYVWKGMIPACLGDILGGGLFVGTYMYYQHLQGVDAPAIDGTQYDASPVGLMDFSSRRVDFRRKASVHEEEVGSSRLRTPTAKPESAWILAYDLGADVKEAVFVSHL